MRTLLPGLAALSLAACFPLDREPQANARPVAATPPLLQALPGDTVVPFIQTGQSPIADDESIEIAAFLEAAEKSLANGEVRVELAV